MPRPDPAAPERRFGALHAAHHDAVLRYFVRRVGREHASDLAAEVFLVAWRRIDAVPRDDALPWLYAVAGNVLANDRRARGRRDALPGRLAHQRLEHGRDTATVVAERDLLRRAFLSLRDADRELLMLVAWDGLTAEQMGRALGCRTAAVHVRLHRARKRLAEQLERATAVGTAAAVVVAMIVAVATFSVLGPLSDGTGPDEAQAGPIAALASRAADVPAFAAPTAERPYAYVRQSVTGPTLVHLPSGRRIPARYRQDVERWQRADGSGRLRTVDAPLAFSDPRDAEAVAAARPGQRRPTVGETTLDDAAHQATNGIGRPLALEPEEIAALPDETTRLEHVLTRTAARTSAAAERPAAAQLGPARAVTDLAADLLSLNAVRPAVRAALVRVIGRDPGVAARPGMRDPTGRSGTGLEWRSAEGHRTVLLVDPATTRVLAQRTSIPDAAAGAPTAAGSEPTIDVWTTILDAGAVAHVGDRPGGRRP